MPHDVFVSYSSKDKPAADAACAVLESRGVRCWVAPRDILPGADWSESIVDAIQGARVMVLVFSSHANASNQIKREVERAVNRGIPVIPVRIEDVAPAKALEYFISMPHWLDAFTPPLEQHLEFLAQTVRQLLGGPGATGSVIPRPAPVAKPWYVRQARALVPAGFGAVVVMLLVVIALKSGRAPIPPGSQPAAHGAQPPDGARLQAATVSQEAAPASQPTVVSTPPAVVPPAEVPLDKQGVKPFVGRWKLVSLELQPGPPNPGAMGFCMQNLMVAAHTNPAATAYTTTTELGAFTVEMLAEDRGTFMVAGRRITLTSARTGQRDMVEFMLTPVVDALPALLAEPGDTYLSLNGVGAGGQATWVRKAGSGQPHMSLIGSWVNPLCPLDGILPHVVTLELGGDFKYTIRFARTESGVLQADNGNFKSAHGGMPIEGRYSFESPDRLQMVDPHAKSVWERVKR